MTKQITAVVEKVDGKYQVRDYQCSFKPQLSNHPASITGELLEDARKLAGFMEADRLEIKVTVR